MRRILEDILDDIDEIVPDARTEDWNPTTRQDVNMCANIPDYGPDTSAGAIEARITAVLAAGADSWSVHTATEKDDIDRLFDMFDGRPEYEMSLHRVPTIFVQFSAPVKIRCRILFNIFYFGRRGLHFRIFRVIAGQNIRMLTYKDQSYSWTALFRTVIDSPEGNYKKNKKALVNEIKKFAGIYDKSMDDYILKITDRAAKRFSDVWKRKN